MPRKPIQSHRSEKSKSSPKLTPNPDIRALATDAQNALQNGDFEKALAHSREIENLLQNDADNAVIYLTSLVWQIRALQGLKRDREEIEQAADRYGEEAARLGDAQRVVQARRIRAQIDIDGGRWTAACEHLENALSLAIENRFGRQTLELLMHLSSLELKMCHYLEAIDYLSRAMNAVRGAGVENDDMREISAAGNRQLCELYNTVGDGQRACDALEAAQNANTKDEEERWLQELLLSRFDMRSGDADTACARLKKIEHDLKAAVRSGSARPAQLAMVQIERAQAIWNHGDYADAIQLIDNIQVEEQELPLRQAIELTRFQWAVEMGQPKADPDEAGKKFSEVCNLADNTDVQILLAASLTQAALEIERGHFETTLESLLHIAQTAAFTQLIPFATRALALRAQIHCALGKYENAAQYAHDACETFVDHVDDVSARQAGAMMLKAQIELSFAAGDGQMDDNELAAFHQLLDDLQRYELHHHESAFIDLGLCLLKIAIRTGDKITAESLIPKLKAHIQPEYMAHRNMSFKLACAAFYKDGTARECAESIAQANGYHLDN